MGEEPSIKIQARVSTTTTTKSKLVEIFWDYFRWEEIPPIDSRYEDIQESLGSMSQSKQSTGVSLLSKHMS